MAKILIIIGLVLVFFGIGAWFVSYGPTSSQNSSKTPSPQANAATPTPKPLTGKDAIKAYAAMQFSIPVESIKVISSEHQEWKNTCFDLLNDPKLCEDKPTSGYQMTFEIKGQTVSYRGNDEGTIIRFVKK